MHREPPTCLVVDDDQSLRQVLTRLLQRECGFDTREAPDGLRALTILEQRSFDVVVCDEHMPGTRGVEVLKTAQERWPKMRRVLYTADTKAVHFDQGFADLVLDKLLDVRHVAEYICTLAKGR